MKKKISLLLAILMLVTLIPTAFAESKTVDAVKNTKKITLDGEEVMVGAYDVEGYNYLKLRDVAAILNNKKCQFNIGFDEPTRLITVELAKGYEKVEGKDEKAKAMVSVKKILVNGEEKEIKTALINEYNYMQLRDLGSLVGLDVKYDKVNKVIMLNSDAQAKDEKAEEKKEEKTEDKKEEKKEEKTEDKKEENKDEKADDKKDENKEGTYTDSENRIFDRMIASNEEKVKLFKDYTFIPSTGDEALDLIGGMVNLTIVYGKRIYMDGAKIEKSIDKKDGKKIFKVKFTYPSGGENTMVAEVEDESKDFNAHDELEIGPIIGLIDADKDIGNMDKLDLLLKFTDVHKAIVANDYTKAVELLRELNYDADEAKLKQFVNVKKEEAKMIGQNVFVDGYTSSIRLKNHGEMNYVKIYFDYNDGSILSFDIFHKTINGLGSIVGVK